MVARSPHNLEARVRSQTRCLFSCEGEWLTCCTLRLANPTSLGVGIPHVCPSTTIPTWEPFPVRFPETTRTQNNNTKISPHKSRSPSFPPLAHELTERGKCELQLVIRLW